MFRFESPEYLYLLLVLPVLIAVHVFSNIRRKRNINVYGDARLLRELMPEVSEYRQSVKFWMVFAACCLSCILLARPQFGTKLETVKRTGIETIICLDISNSMLAEDVTPSRLDKSKRIISNLVDKFKEDKIGLIVFAGDAFVQLPITSDFISAKMFLSSISPALITRQGTDIKGAIDLASRSFTSNESVGKAVIVITDGENHEPGAVEAAEAVAGKGQRVYVLGIGSRNGSPIPGDIRGEFRKDRDGNVVVTKLNEQMCKDIAAAGNGKYFYVDNSNGAEIALRNELDGLNKSESESAVYTEFDEHFVSIALIALVLLLVDICIKESVSSKSGWFRMFGLDKIFKK